MTVLDPAQAADLGALFLLGLADYAEQEAFDAGVDLDALLTTPTEH